MKHINTMAEFAKNLADLFQRDLHRLIEEVEKTPRDQLWQSPEGINNSCGVLVQHLLGNLNHFIGAALGNTGYQRNMDREFREKTLSKTELIEELNRLQEMIREVLDELNDQQLMADYPASLPFEASVQKFLLHLYGHLGYHRGQYNYLRRMLDEN